MLVIGAGMVAGAPGASAHVHGLTPLSTLANMCLVTTLSNTGANRAEGEPMKGSSRPTSAALRSVREMEAGWLRRAARRTELPAGEVRRSGHAPPALVA